MEIVFLYLIVDMRLKFLTLLMSFVMLVTIIVTINRFGFGILEDNFVASLKTTYRSSAHFMGFYGLLNFYLYTMAYVYSPCDRYSHGFYIKSFNYPKSQMTYFFLYICKISLYLQQKYLSPKITRHFR